MAATSTFAAVDGDGYELQMGRWSRRLAPLFLDFCGCADGELVLDVGCGTGSLIAALCERAAIARACGVDLAPVYVEHAARHLCDPRIEWRVGDACALPFDDASFDRVLSLLMLHFVPQPERAIVEMRRVARPGSIVAAAVWDVRGGYVTNRMFFDTAAVLDPRAAQRRAHNYTRPLTRPGELAAAWRAAGFENVREQLLAIRMEFTSFADYWAPYVGSDGPGAAYVSTLDADQRERLRLAVEQAYLDGEADGARSYAASAWAVSGAKPR